MERWAVMASTLPLWKDRKNVMISYSQIDDKPINETFRDTIQFNFSEKAGPGKEPTTVEGVDTLQMIEPGDEGSAAESETKAGNGVRYKWKGSGIMAVSPPAQWQVLGFFLANDPNRSNEDWVVTYFGKTSPRYQVAVIYKAESTYIAVVIAKGHSCWLGHLCSEPESV
ncbi:histidinolphosphatase [Tulasnella sp. JGI-2019a]|nr:histidinolphosphatase [Tulasnella sp. JGI-2019a]